MTTFDPFDYLDDTPASFNDEIAEYVRERLSKPAYICTADGGYDAIMKCGNIARAADGMCDFDIVGSVAIMGAGEDYDVLICSSGAEGRAKIEAALTANGFIEEGEGYPQDQFTSMRFNEINALVTDDREFYDKWVRCVAVCKLVRDEFGACYRPLRVAIHQAIMD